MGIVQEQVEAEPILVVEAPRSIKAPRPSPFRTVWRWHFFAGILITPVLLVVAGTGAIYIFAPEIEQAARSRLIFVEPSPASASPRALVEAAVKVRPELTPNSLTLAGESNRAAIVGFGDAERPVRVFVDPSSGKVLGAVDDSVDRVTTFIQGTLKLHRQLFLGTTGRVVVELSTGWTVVLLVSGIYLWWPRRRTQRGVWAIRWAGVKPYVKLRDLHSVVGAYLMPVALVITVAGHFYTLAWGTGARYALGAAPRPSVKAAKGDKSAPAQVKSVPGVASIPKHLDRIITSTRALYPDRVLRIGLTTPPARGPVDGPTGVTVTAINRFESGGYGPIRAAMIVCDPANGSVLSNRSLAEKPDRLVQSWAYPLHVGSIAGLTSKLIWLLACLTLLALPITGLWMWWERRPKGQVGLPRRPAVGPPLWLAAIVTALSLFYPLVGASALLVAIGEFVYDRTGSRRRVATAEIAASSEF